MRARTGWLCALLLAAPWTAPAVAQTAPKVGKEYQGPANLGFKIKMPEGWEFIPPQPGERNEIGRFSAGEAGRLHDYKSTPPSYVRLDLQLLKFDRRGATTDAIDPTKPPRSSIANFTEWLAKMQSELGWIEQPRKTLTIDTITTLRHSYTGAAGSLAMRALAFEYKLSPELEVVAFCLGPGDDKKWSKFESAYDALGKSFKALATETAATGPKGSSAREVKRHELEQEVASQPGWQLYETPNYFLLSAKNDDPPFLEELQERLEAIRKVYEELYPASVAAEWKQNAKAKAAATATTKPSGDATTSAASAVDPMELSRCSVVRICKDEEQYLSYGTLPNTAGYWSSEHEELVIFDDQKGGGRRVTWATLNHEAFHQYIYYFFGELAPHSWYNEGTGDYFSGYQLKHKKFELAPFDWRQRLIQIDIRQGKLVPLQELVRFTQAQYYSTSKYGTDISDHYAQGWSFIYFLRTAKKSVKCWNPAWETILDTYLRALVETGDLETAVEQAFAGVDWNELENCWKLYTQDG